MNPINLSLAALPGKGYLEALTLAHTHPVSEPLLGTLALNATQLCPQNRGLLDEAEIDAMRAAFPCTSLRLHANVRIEPQRQIIDLAQFDADSRYWQRMAELSRYMGATAYSAHAGQRRYATLAEVIDNTKRAADLFGHRVALEGHYPTRNDLFLVSSWDEYRAVFESGIDMAIDLSHLNIVASKERRFEEGLVREMLASDQAIEVHLSGNEGDRDAHEPLIEAPWWWPLLDAINPNAVVFSEGQH
jgi:hypothetical protein